MTSNIVFTIIHSMECWRNTFAPIHNLWTALSESTSIIILGGFRYPPGNCVQLCSAFIPCGCRFQEFHCVWMLWGFVELLPCPYLSDLSSVHNSDTISDISNNP